MGARGPLKLVAGGSAPEAPTNSAAAVVSPEAPPMPAIIKKDKELKTLWEEIVPELDKAGLVSRADAMSIAMAIVHFRAAMMAYQELAEADSVMSPGRDHDPDDYVKKNPAEHVLRLESSAFLEYAKQLGMTWMSRARTTIPKGESGSGNPFESGASASG